MDGFEGWVTICGHTRVHFVDEGLLGGFTVLVGHYSFQDLPTAKTNEQTSWLGPITAINVDGLNAIRTGIL